MGGGGRGEIAWSVAGRPLPGEYESGDGHLVIEIPSGWLLAVVDGLGHGPQAAEASKVFIATLLRYAEEPPEELFRRSDLALRSTRGCVGSLVAINGRNSTLDWLGVGNVEGILLRSNGAGDGFSYNYITSRGGIVGYRMPEVHSSTLRLEDNDILVLATDGISDGFIEWIDPAQSTGRQAAAILDHCARPNDDALVLVARWSCLVPQEGESLS